MLNKVYSSIAGINICIDYDTPECGEVTREFLRDFLTAEDAVVDFCVKFSSEKKLLKFGFTHSEENEANNTIGMSVDMGSIKKDTSYAVLPDMADQSREVAEFILDNLLRICLQYIIPKYDGIILHSSSVVDEGKSFVFVAPNSGGKSTIASNTGRQVLSDDCVALRKYEDGTWMACGTPWGDVHSSGEFPVRAIFFIEKADRFYCEKIDPVSAAKGLFANSSFSFPDMEKYAHEILENVLDAVTGACGDIPVYMMGFRKDDNVMDLVKEEGFVWNSAVSTRQ
ncbi:MAG: hypothetical protein PVH45_01730 [Candidatus Omnitrophota bacterium]|jgi:hypothetical protein